MTTTVDMQRDRVLLSEGKELQVREDGVFIRSLTQPNKNILLTYNRYLSFFSVITFCLCITCIFVYLYLYFLVLCYHFGEIKFIFVFTYTV